MSAQLPPPEGPPPWGPPTGPSPSESPSTGPAAGERSPTTPPPPGPVPAAPPMPAPVGDQELAPKVVVLWRVSAIGPIVMLLLFTLIAAVAVGGPAWLGPAAVPLLAIWSIGVLPRLRYARWRWRMTDRALELEHGVLYRQVRAVPYFRIQHIDVGHGPLDRWLGLARLEVHTASVTAVLPGLHATAAPRIRTLLLARASDAVAEADRDDDAV